MLQLYSIPLSLYCAKVRIVLRTKNLNKNTHWLEISPPGGYGSQKYKTIVPSGNLPALIDNDSSPNGSLLLADSEAIGEYLNEKYPDPAMLPTSLENRAKYRELSRFHDTRFEPEIRKLFASIMPESPHHELIKTQGELISQRLQQLSIMLDQMPGEFAQHSTPNLADCGFPISFAWINHLTPIMDIDISWPKSVLTYHERIKKLKPIDAELDDYNEVLANYLSESTTK